MRGKDTKDHFVDADCGSLTRFTISKAYNCHQVLFTYFDLCALNMYQVLCSRNDMVSYTLFQDTWHTSTPTLILCNDGTANAWYFDPHQSLIGLCWDTTFIKLSNPWSFSNSEFNLQQHPGVFQHDNPQHVCYGLRFFSLAPSMASPFSWLLVPHRLHPSVPYHLKEG